MEVLWVIAITAVVGGTGAMVGYGIGRKAERDLVNREIREALNSRGISQQTRQRGTPEQERGSDDTG